MKGQILQFLSLPFLINSLMSFRILCMIRLLLSPSLYHIHLYLLPISGDGFVERDEPTAYGGQFGANPVLPTL